MSTQDLAVNAGARPRIATPVASSNSFLKNYFYFSMSLLIAAVVTYGFSHTVKANLISPPPPARPFILYVHAAVFTGWLVFFILQSSLVRTRNIRIHRRLGWFGVGLGAAIPIVGYATAIVMAGFNIANHRVPGADKFLIIPLWDVSSFAVIFLLAILWRTKAEFHRRLIFMASCVLTAAGWGRFPTPLAENWFYAGVDILVLFGVARDLIVTRRIHPVYLYGLPLLIFGQTFALYTFMHGSEWWLKIAHAILS